jgi:hypothetical protein
VYLLTTSSIRTSHVHGPSIVTAHTCCRCPEGEAVALYIFRPPCAPQPSREARGCPGAGPEGWVNDGDVTNDKPPGENKQPGTYRFTERDGRKGPPAGNKTREARPACLHRLVSQVAEQRQGRDPKAPEGLDRHWHEGQEGGHLPIRALLGGVPGSGRKPGVALYMDR